MNLSWIFDGSEFLTRRHCGVWPSSLATANQVANLCIALAYFSIPITLLLFWSRKRQDLPRPATLLVFASFILSCGMGHVSNVIAFYWAPYRLFTAIDIATASVSVYAALRLPEVVRYLSRLPTPTELQRLHDALEQKYHEQIQLHDSLSDRNHELRSRIRTLEKQIATNTWIEEKDDALRQLKKMLTTIKKHEKRA